MKFIVLDCILSGILQNISNTCDGLSFDHLSLNFYRDDHGVMHEENHSLFTVFMKKVQKYILRRLYVLLGCRTLNASHTQPLYNNPNLSIANFRLPARRSIKNYVFAPHLIALWNESLQE
jgi:hypothetical protein